MTSSSWPDVVAVIDAAPYPVVVLPGDGDRGAACLTGLGMTTRSWLGAVVLTAGGLLVDHGWLRVLGSGAPSLPGICEVIDVARAWMPVAHDVLGGRYVWAANSEGRPTIHYFDPASLTWEDLELGYGDWLDGALSGSLRPFYESLRWPGWEDEVRELPLDRGISAWPPLWTSEGKDLAGVSRRAVPLVELFALQDDVVDQLDFGTTNNTS